MFKRVFSLTVVGILIALFSGISAASAAVLPPNQQGNSISVTHDNGHTTVVVTTNGNTVVSMDPPIAGP